jgi:hypothetical protein
MKPIFTALSAACALPAPSDSAAAVAAKRPASRANVVFFIAVSFVGCVVIA